MWSCTCWKYHKESRWLSNNNLFLQFPIFLFSFIETSYLNSQGIKKALPSLDNPSLIQFMRSQKEWDTRRGYAFGIP